MSLTNLLLQSVLKEAKTEHLLSLCLSSQARLLGLNLTLFLAGKRLEVNEEEKDDGFEFD